METEEAFVIGMAGLSCYEFHQLDAEMNKIPEVDLDIKVRLAETPWAHNIFSD